MLLNFVNRNGNKAQGRTDLVIMDGSAHYLVTIEAWNTRATISNLARLGTELDAISLGLAAYSSMNYHLVLGRCSRSKRMQRNNKYAGNRQ